MSRRDPQNLTRKANFTPAEVAMLVKEVSRCAKTLFGPHRGDVWQRRELWQAMCDKLNAAHHHDREFEDLAKKWSQQKRKVQEKRARRPAKQLSLTKVERQILGTLDRLAKLATKPRRVRGERDWLAAAERQASARRKLRAHTLLLESAIKREESTVSLKPPYRFNSVAAQDGRKAAPEQQHPATGEPVQDAFPLRGAAALEEEAQNRASTAASLPRAGAGVQVSSAAQNDHTADLLLCIKGELTRIGDIMEKMLEKMSAQS